MVTVLFGSQTQNAEDVAFTIATAARARGDGKASVLRVDDLPVNSWSSIDGPVVFVVSTTGQGDAPETMLKSWSVLRSSKAPSMEGLKFAVFGMGDSSYSKFNHIAKMLHNRLNMLGGKPLVFRGLGDDQDKQGYETELQPFLTQLWPACGLPADPLVVSDDVPPQPRWRLTIVQRAADNGSLDKEESASKTHDTFKSPMPQRKILVNRRLTSDDHFQDVRHIELERLPTDAEFEPGDVIAVMPVIPASVVDECLKYCGLVADDVVMVEPNEEAFQRQAPRWFFGKPMTARNLFTHVLDTAKTARRKLFQTLAFWVTDPDPEVKERVIELGSPNFFNEFEDFCTRERRSVVDVLDELNVKVPVDTFVSYLDQLEPRLFSLSSAPHETSLSITVGVVEVTTPYKRHRVGLCSAYLANCAVGSSVCAEVRESLTPMMPGAVVPLLLIGPGTGIAPVRSMIRHLVHLNYPMSIDVFTGNRHPQKDFLYGDEFTELARENKIRFSPSFSRAADVKREGEEGEPLYKRYVQHTLVLPDNARRIASLFPPTAENPDTLPHVVVCGNSKQMPKDVETAFRSIFVTLVLRATDDAENAEVRAESYFATCKKLGTFILDTWS